MRKDSDAQVRFTPEQVLWLMRTFQSAPVTPGLGMDRIMFQAGAQDVVDACVARCSAPETLHRALSNLQLSRAGGAD